MVSRSRRGSLLYLWPSQRELAADSENLMDGAKNGKLSLGKAPLVFDLDSAGMQKYVD